MKGLRSELVVATLAAGNVATALLLQLLVLVIVGPGRATDAFFAAAAIPTVVAGVLGVVMPAVLVPRWSASEYSTQVREARVLLAVITVGLGLVSFVLGAAAHPMFSLLYPGFEETDRALAIHLFRIQLPGTVASAASSVLIALYAARLRFVLVELATLGVAVIALAALVAGLGPLGISHAAWVSTGRALALAILLLPAIGGVAWQSAPSLMLVPILRALAPLTAANAYYKSDMLVDRHLLSLAAPGDLSLYSLAHQVFASSSAILGKVWGSNALPSLSRFAANKDRAGFVLLYKRNLIVLAVASIAAALAVAIAAEPVLTLAVLPTRADAGDAQRIALFLVLLSGVLVGGSVGAILAGAFYSLGDTATPTIMSVFTFTVFIVLRVVAFHQAGIEGLCLAVSAYYLTNALLLAVLFSRTLRRRFP